MSVSKRDMWIAWAVLALLSMPAACNTGSPPAAGDGGSDADADSDADSDSDSDTDSDTDTD
ncbi:MAG: hypothetical protein R6V85_18840, partial [Polyangia bacterium]